MSTLPLIPDAALLIGDWLREHPDMQALDARVAASTPKTMDRPWIRVTQLDASDDPRSRIEHLITYPLQLDCYAGKTAMDAHTGQAEASLLARTARAILFSMKGTAADGVVMTTVQFTGFLRAPDTTLEPARERVILTAMVKLHALPA